MEATCKTCRWWREKRNSYGPVYDHHTRKFSGFCHVRPPTEAGFPSVTDQDFCGEHHPKEEANDAR